MVLIFSNSQDPTTDLVIEWLIAFGKEYRRINSEDLTDRRNPFYCEPKEGRIWIQGHRGIDTQRSPIRVCWYRRWNRFHVPYTPVGDPFVQQLGREAQREAEAISRFLFESYKRVPWLTDPKKADAEEKLLTLRMAKESGLKVPDSIITNRREQVLERFPAQKKLIAKPLTDPPGFIDRNGGSFHRVFAESLDRRTIEELPRSFFPSFFQERVEKSHEVRVFYLDGALYPTALFRPPSERTDIKLDNGMLEDMTQMNRTTLPKKTSERLISLMTGLGLNSGSIDLLVKPDGDHVFLEVNPIGQFLGYGEKANHALDRRIAEWLSQKDQEYETQASFVR